MQIEDQAIILDVRKYSERDAIISVFSKSHGAYSGIVKSFQSKANIAICQVGNVVNFVWKARLAEHLGMFSLEIVRPNSAIFMNSKIKISALSAICSTFYFSLSERQSDEYLYLNLLAFFEKLRSSPTWIKDYILLEVILLAELGFGLDLNACVASGSSEELIYISPKSAKAVSKEEGEPYKKLLFPLPPFFKDHDIEASDRDLCDGLRITSYFINKFILSPRNIKENLARRRLEEIFLNHVNQ
jgi:DNA repair protein RecO (recombination protein O)